MTRDAKAFRLKVSLKGSKPPIWRRLLVRGDMPLDDLHDVLQVAMGWTDSHLHQFVVKTPRKRPTNDEIRTLLTKENWDVNWAQVDGERRFSHPDFELDYDEDETKVRLDQIVANPKDKLIYEYDFGDGWKHELLVEKVEPADDTTSYPRCLGGKRSCPPEDCGGIWGYYELLDALADRRHERHKELKGWVGKFDPEHFDCDEVNALFDKMG